MSELSLSMLAVALLLVGGYFWDQATCYAKTEQIGMKSDYSLFGGCRIQTPSGTWVPLENYREI